MDNAQWSPSTSSLADENGYMGSSNGDQYMRSPDPNNPSEYCSTISPLEQAHDVLNRPPPTVMVPVGVLKRGDRPRGEPKQVVFSDGIRPGGDLTETSESSNMPVFPRRLGRIQLKLTSPPVENAASPQSAAITKPIKSSRVVISDLNGTLPPIINYYELTDNSSQKSKPTISTLIEIMQNKDLPPVLFAITKNLLVYAKLVMSMLL